MSLQFLEFDYSEDPAGGGTLDAMASVRPAQLAAVRADIAEVLNWAEATFPGQRGPLEDGGEWDADVQERVEATSPPWHVLTLCVSGSAPFCEVFRQNFGLDDGV
jgi:hypothetical protein